MNRRMTIAGLWLRGARNGVSPLELLRFLSAPTGVQRGRQCVASSAETGDHIRLTLQGADNPLFYPKQFPMTQLYMTMAEIYDPTDWHHYEIPETSVEPDDVIIDCGAAEGLFTLLAAPKCSKAYAIEPHPTYLAALKRTFEGAGNVELVEVALSDSEGTGSLQDEGRASSITDSGEGAPVRITTLDSLFPDTKVTYLKADLEGYEMPMLRGGENLIKRCRPKIAITTYHRKGDAEAIAGYLRSLVPEYNIKTKGIDHCTGDPVMLHAWIG